MPTFAPNSTHAATLQFASTGNVPTDYLVQAFLGNPANPQQNYLGVLPAAGSVANVQPGAAAIATAQVVTPADPGVYPLMAVIYAIPSGLYPVGSAQWVAGLMQVQGPNGSAVGPIDQVGVAAPAGAAPGPVLGAGPIITLVNWS